ncbi:hypothetical protein ACOQFV_08805 [Nocardiopsis changdeensis]|nr:hypothetical protein [Nocardiopsis sp. MT53]QYX36288.1 hypothetical protein K1J57_27130 [Nocardiopsis sp. MT53]
MSETTTRLPRRRLRAWPASGGAVQMSATPEGADETTASPVWEVPAGDVAEAMAVLSAVADPEALALKTQRDAMAHELENAKRALADAEARAYSQGVEDMRQAAMKAILRADMKIRSDADFVIRDLAISREHTSCVSCGGTGIVSHDGDWEDGVMLSPPYDVACADCGAPQAVETQLPGVREDADRARRDPGSRPCGSDAPHTDHVWVDGDEFPWCPGTA